MVPFDPNEGEDDDAPGEAVSSGGFKNPCGSWPCAPRPLHECSHGLMADALKEAMERWPLEEVEVGARVRKRWLGGNQLTVQVG